MFAGPSYPGRTTRRRPALVALAGVAVTSLALSGCSGAAKKAAAQASGDQTQGVTGTAAAGDTLTVAMQAPATTLNPGTINTAFVTYTTLAYEPLIYQASDGSLKPALASSWKYVGSGNKQLDITLREGVKFNDGSAVNAAAVKASLEYAKKANGANAVPLQTISSIDVTGDHTLSIKLTQPNPMLPEMLTQTYGVGDIISPTGLKNPDQLSVQHPSQGAGAYVFDPKQSVAGDHYTYTANPTYYDKSKQHFKKVTLRVIASPQAAINAVQTHQVDVTAGDASTTAQAQRAKLQIVAIPFVWQGLNLIDRGGEVSKPLGNVKVRQAINYALDRPTISKAVLGKYGVPTTSTVVKGGDGWSQAAADRYPYDPAKAKRLLKEAGYPNGFELPVLSIHFAGIDTMGDAISAQLAKVGIKVKPTYVSDEQSYVTKSTTQTVPAVAVGYGAQPMYIAGQGLWLPTAPIFNGFKSSSPVLTTTYLKAASAPAAQRATLDQQMNTWLVENAWFAPVAFSPVFYYASTKIGGIKVSPKAPVASPLDWYATQ